MTHQNPPPALKFPNTGQSSILKRHTHESFYDHEIQISGLIGGEDDAYENFREFIDDVNIPEYIFMTREGMMEVRKADCGTWYRIIISKLTSSEAVGLDYKQTLWYVVIRI